MDVNVRYCRREGHELGALIVQDPDKSTDAKLEIEVYKKGDKFSRDREIVTLVYFWEYPSDVDAASENQALEEIK